MFPGVSAGVLRAHTPLKGHLVLGRSCACRLAFSFLIFLPAAADGQSEETVAVTFHIEQAIRGVIPGEDLTISQWVGRWSGARSGRGGYRRD